MARVQGLDKASLQELIQRMAALQPDEILPLLDL